MLQNAYFLAKIGADTAENEQHFAEILPKTGNYPTGPPGSAGRRPFARPVRARRGRRQGREVARQGREPEISKLSKRALVATFTVL